MRHTFKVSRSGRAYTVKRPDNHAGVSVRATSPEAAASQAMTWLGADATVVEVRPLFPAPGEQRVYRFEDNGYAKGTTDAAQ